MCDPFLLGLLAFLLWDIWTRLRPGLRIPKVTFPWIMIMVLWGGAAIVFGPYRLTAAHEVVRMAKVMVLFLVIANELQTPRHTLHLVAGLTLGVIVQATVGLIQYLTGSPFGLDILGETSAATAAQLAENTLLNIRAFRISAFLYHPNLFGIYLATLLPLIIGAFMLKAGKIVKLFLLSGAVLGVVALVATLSRSSWLSFAVALTLLTCLMIWHRGLRQRSLVAAAIAALVLITASAPFAGRIVARVLESREDAMLGRAEYIHDAKNMIAVKPWFGWGLNSYVFTMPPFTRYGARGVHRWYGSWLPPVHHIYYLWWAETGIVGLAIHLAMWGGIIWVGIRNLRVRNEILFAVNAACLCAMTAFIVDGFFSFSLRVNSALRVFWVLAGIIMAVHYWRLKHPLGRQVDGVADGQKAQVRGLSL